jgi:hypothetical protein
MRFRPKLFLAWLFTCTIISFALYWFFHLPFWAGFLDVAFGLWINDALADWEDSQPGGFNNPYLSQISNHGAGKPDS